MLITPDTRIIRPRPRRVLQCAPMSLAMGMPLDSGGSAFVPWTSISGCVMALRGDHATVSQMTDQTGNGNNATQATGALQPTLTTAINSQATVTFNGSTQFFNLPASLAGITGALTVCMVYKLASTPASTTSYSPVVIQDSGAAYKWQSFRNVGGYTNVDFQAHSEATGFGFSPTLDTNAHVLIWTVDATGGSGHYTASLDNANQTVSTSGSEGLTTQSPAIGGLVVSGAISGNACPFALAELMVYSRQISAGDAGGYASYCNARYGVS